MNLYSEGSKRWQKILIIVCTVFLIIVIFIGCLFGGVCRKGRKSLEESSLRTGTYDEEYGIAPDSISYDGEIYEYRENMLTFLVLGIDDWEIVSPAEDGISGGQADAIFLVALDLDEELVTVIAINRNAMVLLDIYDRSGAYMYQGYGQIALQHGYGDGMEVSCERTVNTVSRVFNNIPVNGYFSVNMGAIATLNDTIGGVELTSMDDFDLPYFQVREGEKIHLEGVQAYYYLKYRDTTVFNSASERMERQKQYLGVFAEQALEKTGEDVRFPLKLYQSIEPFVVTDIDASEMIYLISKAAGYEFDQVRILSVEGETVTGKEFEEFYVDEQTFNQMLLSVFYEKSGT